MNLWRGNNEQARRKAAQDGKMAQGLVLTLKLKGKKMSKQPDRCKCCNHWHHAGHPKGSKMHGSKYDNWCCKYAKEAIKAVGRCKLERKENEQD